jgi:hypothetical protein
MYAPEIAVQVKQRNRAIPSEGTNTTSRVHPGVRGFLVLWLGLGVAFLGMSSPLRAEAAAPAWSAPTLIDSTTSEAISALSCPSKSCGHSLPD